jgi:hypothetical protein
MLFVVCTDQNGSGLDELSIALAGSGGSRLNDAFGKPNFVCSRSAIPSGLLPKSLLVSISGMPLGSLREIDWFWNGEESDPKRLAIIGSPVIAAW